MFEKMGAFWISINERTWTDKDNMYAGKLVELLQDKSMRCSKWKPAFSTTDCSIGARDAYQRSAMF